MEREEQVVSEPGDDVETPRGRQPAVSRRGLVLGLVMGLGFPLALFAVSRVVVALTTVADLTRWASLVNGAGVASSLGLCVLLIPRHGALGASYASLVAYGVCAVIGLGGVLRVAQELRALPPDSTRARTTEEMRCTR